MSRSFTVTWVGDKTREWKSERGTYIDYRIALAEYDAAKTVKLTQKQSTPAPTPGDTIFGGIIVENATNRQTGEEFEVHKLKKEQAQDGSSGFKKATGVQAPLTPQNDDRSARIERQHSQEMAVRILSLENGGKGQANKDQIQHWTDYFCEDLDAYVAARHGQTSPSHGNGQGGGVTTPAPSPEPTLEERVLEDNQGFVEPDSDIPFAPSIL